MTSQEIREGQARCLAVLAHELRHPLAPIRSAVEMVRRLEGKEPHVERAVAIIDRQLALLTHLIDRLFDSAQLATPGTALQREVLDLTEVLAQALEVCQPQLERHTVTATGATGPVFVEGDRLRLIQVFTNLLDNAAKYSDRPGRIEVELGRETETIWARVRDQGRGIAGERLPHIFELFMQGEPGRSPAGFGIGLAVVRSVVAAHGGHIEAHSAGVGQGAEFTVSLPRWLPESAE